LKFPKPLTILKIQLLRVPFQEMEGNPGEYPTKPKTQRLLPESPPETDVPTNN